MDTKGQLFWAYLAGARRYSGKKATDNDQRDETRTRGSLDKSSRRPVKTE